MVQHLLRLQKREHEDAEDVKDPEEDEPLSGTSRLGDFVAFVDFSN